MSEVAFIALGSNLGDRTGHLAFARERIAALPFTHLLAVSAVEETQPLGGRDQPPYLNQMVAVETSLLPRELLAKLHDIEEARGRRREERWASRTLDLDLVSYGDVSESGAELMLPHPGLHTRDFWQREVAEVRRKLSAAT
jgi:2-amino-4-hydroxy-6-hydroxymethyldihydropteridine diphosphokinase